MVVRQQIYRGDSKTNGGCASRDVRQHNFWGRDCGLTARKVLLTCGIHIEPALLRVHGFNHHLAKAPFPTCTRWANPLVKQTDFHDSYSALGIGWMIVQGEVGVGG
jgi:hypothetical protein